MKKTIKIIVVLALLAMGFTACKKEKQTSQTQQQIKYEVTAVGNSNTEIFVTYLGRNNPTGGIDPYDVISITETTMTPWTYEYKSNSEKGTALLHAIVNNNYEVEITAKILVNGIVVKEKTGNDIEIYHLFD